MSLIKIRKYAGKNARSGGFTLIEVLISLVIMALGLLGMTALQIESLKFNNAAFLESQAQFLLTDMAERIRANPGINVYLMTYAEALDPPAVDCLEDSCSRNEMALWDMNQWRDTVEAALPQGETQILFNTLSRVYVISVRYDWSQLGEDGAIDGKRVVSITTRI